MQDPTTSHKSFVRLAFGLSILGLLAGFGWLMRPASSSGTGTYETENVVLVLIDGLRASEAFGFPVGGGTHPYIPHMYHDLMPEGTLLSNMRNRGYTKTVSAMSNIMTGRWHAEPNRGIDTDPRGFRDVRSRWPTLIEHYRRDVGATESQVLFFPSKHNERGIDTSFHPRYGADYAPETHFFDPREIPFRDENNEFIDDENTDDLAFAKLQELTSFSPAKDAEDYPSLMVLALGITDNSGHFGLFDLHGDVIRNMDEIVGDLWNYIQTHPHYADKTTLVVTTDHGRHLVEYGDFVNHTGGCLGCREVFALVLGPDTPADQVVPRRTEQVDIAPTIAELLDFEMPWAIGRPVFEAIGATVEDTRNDSIIDLAIEGEGDEIYTAYRRTENEEIEIVFRRAVVDGIGVAFDPELVLTTEFPDSRFLAQDTTIGLNANGLHVAWVHHLGHDTSGWKARVVTSLDGGASFQPSNLFGNEAIEDASGDNYEVPIRPHFVSHRDTDSILLPMYANGSGDRVILAESNDQFSTTLYMSDALTSARRSAYFRSLDTVTFDDDSIGIVATRSDLLTASPGEKLASVANWEVLYTLVQPIDRGLTSAPPFSTPVGVSQRSPVVRLTSSTSPSVHCRIAQDPADADRLVVVFADQDPSGVMQIFLRESLDRGATWSPQAQLTTSTEGAWEPAVAIDAVGDARIAYVDYDAGMGDILALSVDPFGVVSAPTNLSNSPEISAEPQVHVTDTFGAVVVWIEDAGALQAMKLD